MKTFSYVAKDPSGNVLRSQLTAPDRSVALARLREKGFVVVDLVERDSRAGPVAAPAKAKPRAKWWKLGKAVTVSDKAVFCRQLAITVNAGMPLREALESIANDMDHPTFRSVLQDVVRRLHEGESFSEAIAKHPSHFNTLFVALVRSAEESGSLPETLEQLATYMERSEKLIKKIRSVTAYPMFIFVFFLIILVVMTVFVLPRFMQSFKGFNVQLPPLTRAVFGATEILLRHWIWIAMAVVVPVVALIVYRRTPTGRRRTDGWILKLPFFGVCVREFALARFARNLGIMLRGGVGVTTAMDITSAVTGNTVLVESLQKAKERIINGERIASSLAQDPEIPRLVIRMIGVGEESGRLPEVLEKIAGMYEEQVENRIVTATSLFEPVVICVFGGVVLVLVMAIYLPIFTVAQSVH